MHEEESFVINECDVREAMNATMEWLVKQGVEEAMRLKSETWSVKSSEKWKSLKPLEDPGTIGKVQNFNPFEEQVREVWQGPKPEISLNLFKNNQSELFETNKIQEEASIEKKRHTKKKIKP